MTDTSRGIEDQRSAPWYRRVGPGLITVCVVIGPGSLVTSCTVGATHGYSMLWVVPVAIVCMMTYMTMAARLGTRLTESVGDTITKRAGRWLAAAIGIGIFVVAATFQFGNNLGVVVALKGLGVSESAWVPVACVIAVNVASLLFLFAFSDFYQALEKLMTVFVGIMLLAFLVNLLFAKPDFGAVAGGFVPQAKSIDLTVIALVGTTFSVVAAYYQAYLVRDKGWGEDQAAAGVTDARVATCLMGLITLMLVTTAAAALGGEEKKLTADRIMSLLQPTFGRKGVVMFAVGLLSAAWSSFLINSMIGGYLLADGFGLGSKSTDRWPRLLSVGVLLIGMCVALFAIGRDFKPTDAIIVAQAISVLVAPLMAGGPVVADEQP